MSRTIEIIEGEIGQIKARNPDWAESDGDKALLAALINEKNHLAILQFKKPEIRAQPSVFVVAGTVKFAKCRVSFCRRLFGAAEDNHAKTRVGVADDGIACVGITKHLQFKLVFEKKFRAQNFRDSVKELSQEYTKRMCVELSDDGGVVVFPEISVEFQPIQSEEWHDELVLVDEEQYGKIVGDVDRHSDDDVETRSEVTAVTINSETRLRLLEREDSGSLFHLKPKTCRVVEKADDPNNSGNPNNIVYMSSFLYMQMNAINSTEGVSQFFFRYVGHNKQPNEQGLPDDGPTAPVYETSIEIVFKDEEAKNVLSPFFLNPTEVNETTIRVVAYFPDPREFDYFAQFRAEETLARWASYDKWQHWGY